MEFLDFTFLIIWCRSSTHLTRNHFYTNEKCKTSFEKLMDSKQINSKTSPSLSWTKIQKMRFYVSPSAVIRKQNTLLIFDKDNLVP